MGGKGRSKPTETHSEEEDDFNNFATNGAEDSDDSSDGMSEDDPIGSDGVDETSMDDAGRLRLRAPISLDGEGYAGKKSSRKETLEQDSDEELDLDDAEELTERLRAAYDTGSSDEGDGDEDRNPNLTGDQDDELDALSREYEKLREEEEKGLEILKTQEKDSHQKGQAVRNQKALWDRALEVRIALQKLLGSGNRLPGKVAKDTLSESNSQVDEAYTKLTDSALSTLNCLLDLGSLLVDNNSSITQIYSTVANGNGKREALEDDAGEESVSDRAWEKLDGLYSKVVPYRDNSLDRWQRKTQIYTGAVGKARLRASNQSVSQQVAATMRDSSRVVSRMRLKRDVVEVLGERRLEGEDGDAKENSVASRVEDAVLLRSANAFEEEGDPETFDDSEFYQQLLREFLEQSDPNALGSMAFQAHGRQLNKKRKQVDRRASKGRKLRYNVFEPLRNFMAPKPMLVPLITAQLFGNLFGQKSKTIKSTS